MKSESSKMPLYDLGDIDRMEQMESMEQDDEDFDDGEGGPDEGIGGLASILDSGPNGGPNAVFPPASDGGMIGQVDDDDDD